MLINLLPKESKYFTFHICKPHTGPHTCTLTGDRTKPLSKKKNHIVLLFGNHMPVWSRFYVFFILFTQFGLN